MPRQTQQSPTIAVAVLEERLNQITDHMNEKLDDHARQSERSMREMKDAIAGLASEVRAARDGGQAVMARVSAVEADMSSYKKAGALVAALLVAMGGFAKWLIQMIEKWPFIHKAGE